MNKDSNIHHSTEKKQVFPSGAKESTFYRKNTVLFATLRELREAQYKSVKLHLCLPLDQKCTLEVKVMTDPTSYFWVCNLLYFSLQHGAALYHTNKHSLGIKPNQRHKIKSGPSNNGRLVHGT